MIWSESQLEDLCQLSQTIRDNRQGQAEEWLLDVLDIILRPDAPPHADSPQIMPPGATFGPGRDRYGLDKDPTPATQGNAPGGEEWPSAGAKLEIGGVEYTCEQPEGDGMWGIWTWPEQMDEYGMRLTNDQARRIRSDQAELAALRGVEAEIVRGITVPSYIVRSEALEIIRQAFAKTRGGSGEGL